MILILAIAILGFSDMISMKMKIEKHKKWWVPLFIGGIVFVLMICLFIVAFNMLTLQYQG